MIDKMKLAREHGKNKGDSNGELNKLLTIFRKGKK